MQGVIAITDLREEGIISGILSEICQLHVFLIVVIRIFTLGTINSIKLLVDERLHVIEPVTKLLIVALQDGLRRVISEEI